MHSWGGAASAGHAMQEVDVKHRTLQEEVALLVRQPPPPPPPLHGSIMTLYYSQFQEFANLWRLEI